MLPTIIMTRSIPCNCTFLQRLFDEGFAPLTINEKTDRTGMRGSLTETVRITVLIQVAPDAYTPVNSKLMSSFPFFVFHPLKPAASVIPALNESSYTRPGVISLVSLSVTSVTTN